MAARGPPDHRVDQRLSDPDQFIEDVRRSLVLSGFDSTICVLEITESTLMSEPEETVGWLARLKELDVMLAIDDFGTGYSSMAYLQKFPIDVLKINRSFVRAISAEPESLALIRTMVQLGVALS